MGALIGLSLGDRLPEGGEVWVAVGTFDGVHLGHQKLMAAGRKAAALDRARLLAITFQPHPRSVLGAGLDMPLLTPLSLRRRLLERAGAELVWVMPFDAYTRELSAGAFLDILGARFTLRGMVAGEKAALGRGGRGGVALLAREGRRRGFAVEVVEPAALEGRSVSSSRIRAALGNDSLEAVAAQLGRRFNLLGYVVTGERRGRRLGFPTANLALEAGQALPSDGVYVMRMSDQPGRWWPAVGSIGTRPHFSGSERAFEVHVLGDPGDLYGLPVEVEICLRLRGQEKFAGDRELIARMREDAREAQEWLARGEGS